jgi:phage baseplate assembly protein W
MALITPLRKKRVVYSDITKDLLTSDTCYNDLLRNVNEEAVKESIYNLIMVGRGERLMQPYLGSPVRELLFENFGPAEAMIAKNRIESLLEEYEPRANILEVRVDGDPDNHFVYINITFEITTREEPVQFDITLRRIR